MLRPKLSRHLRPELMAVQILAWRSQEDFRIVGTRWKAQGQTNDRKDTYMSMSQQECI